MTKLAGVESILERQVLAWERQRKQLAGRRAPEPRGPWITVSRQLGSGGTELAHRIGKELGWLVYDHELLAIIAEHTHTRETVLRHLDEQAMGPVRDYLERLLDPGIPGHVPFLQEMMQIIAGLARKGRVVIVGRGANWFLEPAHGLRVRIVAPLDQRCQTVAEVLELPPDRAEQRVRANDAQQADYVRQVFHASIDDPLGYDLVLNLGAMDPDTACQATLGALQHRFQEAGVAARQ